MCCMVVLITEFHLLSNITHDTSIQTNFNVSVILLVTLFFGWEQNKTICIFVGSWDKIGRGIVPNTDGSN